MLLVVWSNFIVLCCYLCFSVFFLLIENMSTKSDMSKCLVSFLIFLFYRCHLWRVVFFSAITFFSMNRCYLEPIVTRKRKRNKDNKCLYSGLLMRIPSSNIQRLHSMYIRKFICISLM
jgi:hypothetical protein